MAGVTQLPTLPSVYSSLQKVLSNPHVSARDVSSVVEQDQALASKLLRIVNSAYYGFPGKISSLNRTIVLLGFTEVRNLSLSISVMGSFAHKNSSTEFNYENFWRHAIGVAVCSGILAKKAGPSICGSHEEAFVAGLIHDIGIILEHQLFSDEFKQATQIASKENRYIIDAEKKVLGFSHDESGAFLSETWNLPKKLCNAVEYHHNPANRKHDAINYPIIATVHIADIIANMLGLGTSADSLIMQPDKVSWGTLGINISALEEIAEECLQAFDEMVGCLLTD
jgi:putative nucleotidyltransferase with HDIG domain